jgi:hypothetical protein
MGFALRRATNCGKQFAHVMSANIEVKIPVLMTRNEIAERLRLPTRSAYDALAKVAPDALTVKGAKLFYSNRLDEIAALLKAPSITA